MDLSINGGNAAASSSVAVASAPEPYEWPSFADILLRMATGEDSRRQLPSSAVLQATSAQQEDVKWKDVVIGHIRLLKLDPDATQFKELFDLPRLQLAVQAIRRHPERAAELQRLFPFDEHIPYAQVRQLQKATRELLKDELADFPVCAYTLFIGERISASEDRIQYGVIDSQRFRSTHLFLGSLSGDFLDFELAAVEARWVRRKASSDLLLYLRDRFTPSGDTLVALTGATTAAAAISAVELAEMAITQVTPLAPTAMKVIRSGATMVATVKSPTLYAASAGMTAWAFQYNTLKGICELPTEEERAMADSAYYYVAPDTSLQQQQQQIDDADSRGYGLALLDAPVAFGASLYGAAMSPFDAVQQMRASRADETTTAKFARLMLDEETRVFEPDAPFEATAAQSDIALETLSLIGDIQTNPSYVVPLVDAWWRSMWQTISQLSGGARLLFFWELRQLVFAVSGVSITGALATLTLLWIRRRNKAIERELAQMKDALARVQSSSSSSTNNASQRAREMVELKEAIDMASHCKVALGVQASVVRATRELAMLQLERMQLHAARKELEHDRLHHLYELASTLRVPVRPPPPDTGLYTTDVEALMRSITDSIHEATIGIQAAHKAKDDEFADMPILQRMPPTMQGLPLALRAPFLPLNPSSSKVMKRVIRDMKADATRTVKDEDMTNKGGTNDALFRSMLQEQRTQGQQKGSAVVCRAFALFALAVLG